jgi:hypothetical protein
LFFFFDAIFLFLIPHPVPSQGLKIAENSSLGVSENTSEWRLGPESLVIQEKSWKHETIPHAAAGFFLDK